MRHRDHAVNVLRMTDVAGKGGGAIGKTDPIAGGFGARRITRQQNDRRALCGKPPGDGFPNAHRSAGDHHNFPG